MRAMRGCAVALATVGVMALGALSASVARAAEDAIVGEVIIEATALSPAVLLTAPSGGSCLSTGPGDRSTCSSLCITGGSTT
mgnify:CR=1 FL=1